MVGPCNNQADVYWSFFVSLLAPEVSTSDLCPTSPDVHIRLIIMLWITLNHANQCNSSTPLVDFQNDTPPKFNMEFQKWRFGRCFSFLLSGLYVLHRDRHIMSPRALWRLQSLTSWDRVNETPKHWKRWLKTSTVFLNFNPSNICLTKTTTSKTPLQHLSKETMQILFEFEQKLLCFCSIPSCFHPVPPSQKDSNVRCCAPYVPMAYFDQRPVWRPVRRRRRGCRHR